MKVKLPQSCLTLCDPKGCSPPVSSIYGIFQARVLEWVAISFSRDLPDPGIEHRSPALQANTLLSETPGKPTPGGKMAVINKALDLFVFILIPFRKRVLFINKSH